MSVVRSRHLYVSVWTVTVQDSNRKGEWVITTRSPFFHPLPEFKPPHTEEGRLIGNYFPIQISKPSTALATPRIAPHGLDLNPRIP